jgi:hypothetical protein
MEFLKSDSGCYEKVGGLSEHAAICYNNSYANI